MGNLLLLYDTIEKDSARDFTIKNIESFLPDDVLSADLAAYRAKVIYDLMQIDQGRN